MKHCKGKRDPSAPHDLTKPGALTNAGYCRACKQHTDRQKEAKRKAARQASVKENRRWCTGKIDPSAPHDLTQAESKTSNGKCKRCKHYVNGLRRRQAGDKAKAFRAAIMAGEVDTETAQLDRGRDVRPTGNQELTAIGASWQSVLEDREARGVFAELFAIWPEPEDPNEPLPAAREDWLGIEKEKAETDTLVESERYRCRMALSRMCHDPSQSSYNRRLAWQALTDYREDE